MTVTMYYVVSCLLDSKIQKWENGGNRQLFIKHKIVLIYAPWNKETKIMDESVRAYGESICVCS